MMTPSSSLPGLLPLVRPESDRIHDGKGRSIASLWPNQRVMRDYLYPRPLIAVKELMAVGKPISIGLKYVVGMPGKGSRKHSRDEPYRSVETGLQ
jgi:hypothetical protein